ncbi:chloride channel protein EriC [Chthonomonas calidirosea]|uniref:Chloride channel protein EriC n=1 Tax=Chthonomonas calidirosea (strain DSM 23976 / ICMP 18418 / T49) TaxID=1303518 RepID=S0EZW0_CHTCT|nr:chloride channel protein [Chthonomonas calidirosea]CCW36115.1 Chloride channel protein EriC [Chthonomonas calidirosea T49]CEK18295.1 chloride channel protein EriC [Chthonomonas calidirosea]
MQDRSASNGLAPITPDADRTHTPQKRGFRLWTITALAVIIGVLAAFVAYLLYDLISLLTNVVFYHKVAFTLPNITSNPLGPWLVLVPAIGGLIVGLMAKYGTPKIKGHGIPEAMEAVVTSHSKVEAQVAILKPLSAAIAIGTGGPFGAEGPIIQTGGAVGSLVGQLIDTTPAERKVLLACGAAAGMAAIFSTPIAAVILAIELLLFEFKPRSFIPVTVASAIATIVRYQLLGTGLLFKVGPIHFNIFHDLPFYILLGPICGLAAIGYTRALYWFEDLFDHLRVDDVWKPAIGGLILGVIGLFAPRVLGVGYGNITAILNNQLPVAVLLTILIFKSLALLISLGSETSGGLLAPMLMSGGALGALYAIGMNHLCPAASLSPGAFAVASMAAIFGAASRSTFAFILFGFEITRNYGSLLPLMIVSAIADGVVLLFLRETTIMTEKLARRGLTIPQEYEADVLQQVKVDEVMDRTPGVVPAKKKLAELAKEIGTLTDPQLHKHRALLVVDAEGKLAGIVTRGDILRALEQHPDDENLTVLDVCSRNLVVTYEDETVYEAMEKMLLHDIGRLPVVKRKDPQQLVGYLGRAEVLKARFLRFQEEQQIQPGWWRAYRGSRSGPPLKSGARPPSA